MRGRFFRLWRNPGRNPGRTPRSQNGGGPLHVAAWEGHVGVVRVLLAAGADKEARGKVRGKGLAS